MSVFNMKYTGKKHSLDFEGWEGARFFLVDLLGLVYLSFLVMLKRSFLTGKDDLVF